MEITHSPTSRKSAACRASRYWGKSTYGLERLRCTCQGKESVYDLIGTQGVTYGTSTTRTKSSSTLYFELSNAEMLFAIREFESEASA